ncbi:hypothetical protein WT14_14820 [Burkholderia stagnalis]|nr:hypothetical protein WT14_14820 [Burkholderia stagnalis]
MQQVPALRGNRAFAGFLRIDVGQRERCGVSRSIRLRGAMVVALRRATQRSPIGGQMIAIAIVLGELYRGKI